MLEARGLVIALVISILPGLAAAQPAGKKLLSAAVPADTAGEEDLGTMVYLLGDATFSVTDVKNVNAVGLGIRGPEWWLRFFVSNATDSKTSADPGDQAFGRAVLNPEIGGLGATAMVRYLRWKIQDRPDTRWGFVADLEGQHMTWETGGMSRDGLAGGADFGVTILAESKLTPPNDANGVLAYADLLMMVRGLNRDFGGDLRKMALGTTDREFSGVAIRAGAKINQLTFSATYSWFPTDHNVVGLTGGQLMVSIGVDSGIELQWAPPKTSKQKADQPVAPPAPLAPVAPPAPPAPPAGPPP